MPRIAWENRARAKRASLYAAIPSKWKLKPTDLPPSDGSPSNVTQWPRKFLTGFELAITETSALDVLANIHTGIWSAEDVTGAFCHRAAIAHQLVNCLTEIHFDVAMEQARQLDQHRLTTGGLTGPLHGLPVSFSKSALFLHSSGRAHAHFEESLEILADMSWGYQDFLILSLALSEAYV